MERRFVTPFHAGCAMRVLSSGLLIGVALCAGCASPEQRAERHSRKAVELFASQRYRSAWRELDKARACGVGCPIADSLQGVMLLRRGEIGASEEMLLRAAAADPSNSAVRNNLAVIYLITGRAREAAESLRTASASALASSEILNNYGLALRRLGDFKGSARAFLDAMHRNPRNSDAAANYAFALFLQGKKREAVTHWETAVYIHEDNPDALAGLAVGRMALGQEKEARQAAMRAMVIDSSYVNDDVLVNVRNWPPKEAKVIAQLIRTAPGRRAGFYPSPLAMKSFGSALLMDDPEVARIKARQGSL